MAKINTHERKVLGSGGRKPSNISMKTKTYKLLCTEKWVNRTAS